MSKLNRVISAFTNGELQILTGIPASVIAGFRSGRFTPSQRSIERLTPHYTRKLPDIFPPLPPPPSQRAQVSSFRYKHNREVDFVLKSLSNKDITQGTAVERPGHTGRIIETIKYSKKKGKQVFRSAEVGTVAGKVKGEKIDPRLLNKMRTGETPGTKAAVNSLLKVYRSLNRQLLLAAGASDKEAWRFAAKPLHIVEAVIKKYREIAAIIAKRKKVPIEQIIAGMQRSEKDFESYDYYISAVLK
jgi:hypothetical protein